MVAAAVILLAGCSSMPSHTAHTQMSGMMCDKCQAVWFPKVTQGGKPGSGQVAYRMTRRMICPQCESIAAKFFRTGRLAHTCPACGGSITRCTAQVVPQQKAGSSSAP